MNLLEAEDLAARIIAAIDVHEEQSPWASSGMGVVFTADRERVASDLAGLRRHFAPGEHIHPCPLCDANWPCSDSKRYQNGLRRTAELYGVSL